MIKRRTEGPMASLLQARRHPVAIGTADDEWFGVSWALLQVFLMFDMIERE